MYTLFMANGEKIAVDETILRKILDASTSGLVLMVNAGTGQKLWINTAQICHIR